MADPFKSFKEDVENEARKTADSSWDSPFHTLGRGATQAAPGNHTHPASEIKDLPPGTSLSNAIPKISAGSGSAGVGTAASRDDHVHPPPPGINLATNTPPADSGTGAVGTSGSAAREDHQHPAHNVGYADNAGNAANADTVDGKHAVDFATSGHTHDYSPSSHTHAANPPLATTAPPAIGTAAVGVGTAAARNDHVHPTTGLALSGHTHPGSVAICTFASGWDGYTSPRLIKDGNTVSFNGFFRKVGSALTCVNNTNYVLATIPAGYRPIEVINTPALLLVGTDDGINTAGGVSGWVLARVSIETSGTIQFMLNPGADISVDQWMIFNASWYAP